MKTKINNSQAQFGSLLKRLKTSSTVEEIKENISDLDEKKFVNEKTLAYSLVINKALSTGIYGQMNDITINAIEIAIPAYAVIFCSDNKMNNIETNDLVIAEPTLITLDEVKTNANVSGDTMRVFYAYHEKALGLKFYTSKQDYHVSRCYLFRVMANSEFKTNTLAWDCDMITTTVSKRLGGFEKPSVEFLPKNHATSDYSYISLNKPYKIEKENINYSNNNEPDLKEFSYRLGLSCNIKYLRGQYLFDSYATTTSIISGKYYVTNEQLIFAGEDKFTYQILFVDINENYYILYGRNIYDTMEALENGIGTDVDDLWFSEVPEDLIPLCGFGIKGNQYNGNSPDLEDENNFKFFDLPDVVYNNFNLKRNKEDIRLLSIDSDSKLKEELEANISNVETGLTTDINNLNLTLEWESDKVYNVGDNVLYEGVLYKALWEHSNKQPNMNLVDWEPQDLSGIKVISTGTEDTYINIDSLPYGKYRYIKSDTGTGSIIFNGTVSGASGWNCKERYSFFEFVKSNAGVFMIDYDSGWHNLGETGEPAFLNGWIEFSTFWAKPRFKRENNKVVIQGMIQAGTNGVIFILPEFYRPDRNHVLFANASDVLVRLEVESGGCIVVFNYSGRTSIEIELEL